MTKGLEYVERMMVSFMLVFVLFIASFFLFAYLIMVAYNNSVPKMSDQHKEIDYTTALWFTLLINIIALYFKCGCGTNWKPLKS